MDLSKNQVYAQKKKVQCFFVFYRQRYLCKLIIITIEINYRKFVVKIVIIIDTMSMIFDGSHFKFREFYGLHSGQLYQRESF